MDITDERNRFEVRVYIRYNRDDDTELKDLFDIEKQILSLLETAVLADKLIVLEQKTWNRGEVKKNPFRIHGEQSTLTVVVLEKKSTTGQGVLGAEMSITLPSSTVIPLLSLNNSPEGFDFDQNLIDTQERVVDPTGDRTSLFYEIEDSIANNSAVQPYLGTIDTITETKKTSSRQIKVAFIEIIPTAPFDNIQRAVLHLEKTI